MNLLDFKITFNNSNTNNCKPVNVSKESANTCNVAELNLTEFAELVCQPQGRTWCPAIFKDNKRKNDNWVSQQVFALDFDNGLTPEQALTELSKYNIIPNMVYGSFSDTLELRKFRVVLVLDRVINDATTAKWITVQLMNLFGQKADKACKDSARMFYGSKHNEPEFINHKFVNTDELFDVLNTVTIANDGGRTRNVVEPIFGTRPELPYIYMESSDTAPKTELFNNGEMIEKFDFDKAANNVQIFADFINGEWLTHPQLFGIATSLRWIEGGLKLMRDTMNKYNKSGKTFYSPNNFSILTYVAKMKYTPNNLSNYSPYEEDHNFSNIIFATKMVRGTIDFISKESEITVDEAYERLVDEFSRILEKREKGKVFILRVPTGLGKSELLSQLKVSNDGIQSATIAFPTHSLKNEIAERFAKNGEEVRVTPELPKFSDEIAAKLQRLYDAGLYSDVNDFVKEISKDPKEYNKSTSKFFGIREVISKYDVSDVKLAKEYLTLNNECYNETSKIVLTTHTKATFVNFASDIMIYDECPLQQILSIKNLNATELKTIINNLPESEDKLKTTLTQFYNRLVDFVMDSEFRNTEVISMLAEKRDVIREVILNPKSGITTTSFLSFIDSCYYIKHSDNTLHYVCRRDFQGFENKTIIVMSATAATSVYENLGIPCEIIDLGKVRIAGKIVQDTTYSYSKTSLSGMIDKVAKKVGKLPVITFADMKHHFENPVLEMHFGNCSGYDGLKGQDIAVVGTYNRPSFVYALMALALNEKILMSDLLPEVKTVTYNNCNFQLNTFKNKLMTKIQLDMINQELVQAVGRSRVLREKCQVKLYSGFPLRETTEFTKTKYK